MRTIRVFIAHSKQDSDARLAEVQERIDHVLRAAASNVPNAKPTKIETVLGRDDHAQNFKRAGSWEAWASDIIDRIDHVTRETIYSAIVVTNRHVGMATARVVEAALRARRPLLLLCEDGTLRPIRRMDQTSYDAATGWEVIAE